MRQGFPLKSKIEKESHKERIGTIRSTCGCLRVGRAVPGASPCGKQSHKSLHNGQPKDIQPNYHSAPMGRDLVERVRVFL